MFQGQFGSNRELVPFASYMQTFPKTGTPQQIGDDLAVAHRHVDVIKHIEASHIPWAHNKLPC